MYNLYIYLLCQISFVITYQYPKGCELKYPSADPRNCSIYTIIPRQLDFFKMSGYFSWGNNFPHSWFSLQQCKQFCMDNPSCYSVYVMLQFNECFAVSSSYPITLKEKSGVDTYIIACCGEIPENINDTIPARCKQTIQMPSMRTCYISIYRELTILSYPTKRVIANHSSSGKGLSKCTDDCKANENCLGFSITKKDEVCLYFTDQREIHEIAIHKEYDSYLMVCCFFNKTINETFPLPGPTCQTFNESLQKNCVNRRIEWLSQKAVIPTPDTYINRVSMLESECKTHCLQTIECVMIIIFKENASEYCDLHKYNEHYLTYTYQYVSFLAICCGKIPSPDEELCKKEDVSPGFTCHKFCRERFLQCKSNSNIGCNHLCRDCLVICRKGMIDNGLVDY